MRVANACLLPVVIPHAYRSVVVLGDVESTLLELLRDLLRDLGLVIAEASDRPPRFVIAILGSTNLTRVLGAALAAARGAPVVAIVPLGHHRASTALECGASGVFELGAPTEQLRALLTSAAREGDLVESRSPLGENTLIAIRILRGDRRRSRRAFPDDAERELELALWIDRGRGQMNARRLGPAAIAELHRWNASDAECALVEAAVHKDAVDAP